MKWSDLRNLQGFRRYPAALGVVVAATLIAELLFRTLETTRLSMIFLAGVVVSAVWLGSGPAFFAAGLAFVIYNFYLVDPRFTVQFASAEDFIVLTVFLVVAMLTGGLAGRVRDGARKSDARARTTGALLAASREFALSTGELGVRERLAVHLADAAKGEAVVWDGVSHVAEPVTASPPESFLRDVLDLADQGPFGSLITTEASPWRARLLRSEDSVLGVAAWRAVGQDHPDEDEARLVNVLIDMGATAISRARLATIKAETEGLARAERLQNALLSSVSHDLRTPLASILASASSLQEFGERFTPEVRADLAATIQEEAERLNHFVGNLLNFTRLEGGALRPDLAPIPIKEMIERVVARIEPRRGARILTQVYAGRDAVAEGDAILLDQALGNVIENAVRYSPDESEILIFVQGGELVRIEVIDNGPGVPPPELDQIFEKFFRGRDTGLQAQGTGLGLSITRGFVEAMGGTVHAELRGDRSGLVVVVQLPWAQEIAR